MSEPKPVPASPIIYPEAKPYWDAANEGRLLLMRCDDCGEPYFHPRPFCPFCISNNTVWVEAAGTGTIYTFTHMARAPVFQVPAMIALDEGPIMMSAVIDGDPATLAIGQRVQLAFVPSADGTMLPVFRPA
jgi:uncharacterized OB-fold protein